MKIFASLFCFFNIYYKYRIIYNILRQIILFYDMIQLSKKNTKKYE